MRYTEARLTEGHAGSMLLADLDKNVVDFGPNFDETEKEPRVLPMRDSAPSDQWCGGNCSRYGDQYPAT